MKELPLNHPELELLVWGCRIASNKLQQEGRGRMRVSHGGNNLSTAVKVRGPDRAAASEQAVEGRRVRATDVTRNVPDLSRVVRIEKFYVQELIVRPRADDQVVGRDTELLPNVAGAGGASLLEAEFRSLLEIIDDGGNVCANIARDPFANAERRLVPNDRNADALEVGVASRLARFQR